MTFPVKRPLFIGVCFLAAGIWCAHNVVIHWSIGLLLAVGALAVGWCLDRPRLKGYLFLAAFCLGTALFNYASLPEETIAPYLGQEAVLSGRVVNSPSEAHYVVLAVEECNGQPLPHGGQAVVTKPYDDETVYERGTMVQAHGTLKPLLGATNPGGFNAKAYWNSQGVFYQLKAQETLRITAESQGIWRLGNGLRERLSSQLQNALPEEQYHLVTALLFGEKGELDQDFYSLSQKFGIAHVFAVSGLHVGYLVMMVMLLLRLLKMERSWIAVILLAVVLAVYCLMIGLPPSAIRASLMAVLGLLAAKWLRYKDMYTIMAVAALAILIGQPRALWSIGFQLSFAATWGLLYLYQPLVRALAWLKWPWLRNALGVALAAQLVSAPLVAWHFYLFSAYAPLINIIVVPLIGLLVPLLIGALALSLCVPFLGELVFLPCELLMHLLIMLLNTMADLFGTGHIYIGQPQWLGIVGYYLLLVAWRQGWLKRWGSIGTKGFLAAAMAALLMLSLPTAPREDQVIFLDVGQGSSAVAKTPQGRVLVFDGGMSAATTAGYLRFSGVNRVDAIVLSHGDVDHSTGLAMVLRDFKVQYLVLGQNALQSPEVQTLLQLAHAQQTKVLVVTEESTLVFDGTHQLQVGLYGSPSEDSNAQEVIACWQSANGSCVFPGDSAQDGLEQWLSDRRKTAAVWAVPHHGSKNSCYPGLYQQVRPQVAVISAGRDNRYGHPHQEVLQALEEAKIPYYRTDQQGAVTVDFLAGELKIHPYLSQSL